MVSRGSLLGATLEIGRCRVDQEEPDDIRRSSEFAAYFTSCRLGPAAHSSVDPAVQCYRGLREGEQAYYCSEVCAAVTAGGAGEFWSGHQDLRSF